MPWRGSRPAFDATVTITPRRRGSIRRATAVETVNTPVALTAKIRSQSA